LLVVVAILGLLAAIAAPVVNNLRKGDAGLSASRQMLDAVAYARQLARSQRTTVYMVFVPPDFWDDPSFKNNIAIQNSPTELIAATNLLDKQFTGFAFVTRHSLADQPGQNTARYLTSWKALSGGSILDLTKFGVTNVPTFYTIYTNDSKSPPGMDIVPFNVTTNVPFPRAETVASLASPTRPYAALPYIAFNYLGQLTTEELTPLPSHQDEFIPLAHGSMLPAINVATRAPIFDAPSVELNPPGNNTNSYNVIHIDWLTGHARVERQEVR
jgi:type II secretory pathway pseudopilin PulG